VIDAARQASRPEVVKEPAFEVWPENMDAVLFFCSLGTQWEVVAGFSSLYYVGIPSPRIEASMNLNGIAARKRKQLFHAVQVMERSALKALNAPSEK